MRKTIVGLLALAAVAAAAEYDVVAFCENKWQGQFAMQQYCLERERQGALQVQAFANQYRVQALVGEGKESDPAVQIWLGCVQKWEPQYSMAAYCIEREATAARALNKLK